MHCPNCDQARLVELPAENDVLVDRCGDCGGVWLDGGEIYLFGTGQGVLAVDLVTAVFAQKVDQVFRRYGADRHQRTEVHQQGTVAIQYDHLPIGVAQSVPQAVGYALAHGADGIEVQWTRLDHHPNEGGVVSGNDNLVAVIPRQDLQAFIAFHRTRPGLPWAGTDRRLFRSSHPGPGLHRALG